MRLSVKAKAGALCLLALISNTSLATSASAERVPLRTQPKLAPRAYLVSTYDGSTLRLYLNGREVAQTAATGKIDLNGYPIEIAASAGGSVWDGTIDEPAIYNATLSPSQIADHYALGSGTKKGSYPTTVEATPGLVAYWHLDERRGPAIDVRGGHDGSYTPGVIRGSPGLITGDPDRAASFNGNKGSINIPVAGDLGITDQLSLELWLTAGRTGNRGLLGRFNSYYLRTDPGRHFAAAIYSGAPTTRNEPAARHWRQVSGSEGPKHLHGATGFFLAVIILVALASLGWIVARRGREDAGWPGDPGIGPGR